MRSLILGGGVPGCALAASLRGTPLSHEALILEPPESSRPTDSGVVLNSTGLGALEIIAPEFDWRTCGRLIDSVSIHSRDGRTFSRSEIDDCVAVRGTEFSRMLHDAGGSIACLQGWQCVGLERGPDGAATRARLADGGSIEAGAFFACDGIDSPARELISPHARRGELLAREIVGVAESPALAAQLGRTFHKFHDTDGGLAVELVAVGPRAVACFMQYDPRRWSPASHDAEALATFARAHAAGWSPLVQEGFASLRAESCQLVDVLDLAPLDQLAEANVAVVGDTAHAAFPFASQCANDALADAALLNNLLHDAVDVAGVRRAFKRYSQLRWPHHRRRFEEGRALCREFLAPVPQSGPKTPLVA